MARQGDSELHEKFCTEKLKRKVENKFFQAIKRKVKRQCMKVIMFYGDGSFESCSPGEPGEMPAGSMKRVCKWRFLTRSANEHRTSRSCIHCKQEDVTRSKDHAYNMRCESLTGQKQWMHKDKLRAHNIRRSGISDAKGRQRPLDLRILRSELSKAKQ